MVVLVHVVAFSLHARVLVGGTLFCFVLFFLNGDELVREHHYNERSDLCLGEICISLWINDLTLGAGSQFG